jgi:integrase
MTLCSLRGEALRFAREYSEAGDSSGLRPSEHPRVGWHTFRHTHATLLHELGESVKTAQAILGHSDIGTTLQIYTQAVPETMSKAEERLAQKLMDPKGPKLETGAVLDPKQGAWIQ